MPSATIVGLAVPGIPWEERPPESRDVLWRYSGNPIIPRFPFPGAQGVYNSAAVAVGDAFVGVMRVEHRDGMPRLHLGRSRDGISWTIEGEPIRMDGADPEIAKPATLTIPRVVRLEDWWYVTWCNDYHGPTIGIARTRDFQRFEQLENAFLPFNRNGVLFPRRIGELPHAEPSQRRRAYALRGHLRQREPGHRALGPAPLGDGSGRAVVAVRPRSAPGPSPSRPTRGGCPSTKG